MLSSMQKCSTRTGTAMEIIQPPPPEIRAIIETIALDVSQMGLEFEKKIKTKNAREPKLNFLMSSDHPYHAFYQYKLKEYLAASEQQDARDVRDPEKIIWVPPQPRQLSVELHKAAYRQVPEGTTVKEIDIMQITAQFVARFGPQFWDDLKEKMIKDPRFDFMNNSNSKYAWFWMLRTPYSESLMCRANKPRESDAYMTTVFECFSLFLQRVEQNDYGETRQEMDKFDWQEFMCGVEWKDFADNPSMMLMTLTTKNPAVY